MSVIHHSKKINPDTAALVVIDLQERFASAIDSFGRVVENTVTAIKGAQILGIPVVVTEQYPRGLGHSVKEISEAVEGGILFEKSSFSALGDDKFKAWLENAPVTQVVLAGIEAHICVAQTAVDLIACGYEVFFLEECLSSRTPFNRHNGIDRMKVAGAIPFNNESFFFEALGVSTHPCFKEISALLK